MKKKLLYLLIPVLLLISCSGNIKKTVINNTVPEMTLQTVAVYKSAEQIYENEWKLVFRKLDDSLYIELYADISKIQEAGKNLITLTDNEYVTNPDFVNLRFFINYSEETVPDPETGGNVIINRLIDISRSHSDRFASAGFEDDKPADDFILDLKNYVKTNSVEKISGMVSYPLNVVINKKKVKISEPGSFIKEYDTIFNNKVKNSVISQPLADVQASSKGLMIGTGEIWIKSVEGNIRIISINPK